jgi:hypothetical protein
MCQQDGVARRAEVADHVEPHSGDWNKFRLGALQSLCWQHHESSKKREEQRGYSTRIGLDGWPVDMRHPAYSHNLNDANHNLKFKRRVLRVVD